ncbi:MAG: cytochrome c3 family protein [Desulfobulbaceae bacterium]|nr:cytochrome c3 family protein [Desulfobulbaceae bacterium]
METIVEDLSKTFRHVPFVKDLCYKCHLNGESNKFLFTIQEIKNSKDERTRSHTNLEGKEFTSLTICSTCHPESVGTASHPVNFIPAKKTSIPGEYPTLPDGRITCITCHKPHASNHEYRLIKPRDHGFCVGCHPSKKIEDSEVKFRCRGKCNKEL